VLDAGASDNLNGLGERVHGPGTCFHADDADVHACGAIVEVLAVVSFHRVDGAILLLRHHHRLIETGQHLVLGRLHVLVSLHLVKIAHRLDIPFRLLLRSPLLRLFLRLVVWLQIRHLLNHCGLSRRLLMVVLIG
jgi:hypothetical protein